MQKIKDKTIEWLCQECNCSPQAAFLALSYAKNDVFTAKDYLSHDNFKYKMEREAIESEMC